MKKQFIDHCIEVIQELVESLRQALAEEGYDIEKVDKDENKVCKHNWEYDWDIGLPGLVEPGFCFRPYRRKCTICWREERSSKQWNTKVTDLDNQK